MVLSVAASSGNNTRRTSAALQDARARQGDAMQGVCVDTIAQGMRGYGSAGDVEQQAEAELGADDCARAYEVADDRTPVGAFFEIRTIRRLLLESVDVVLLAGQVHSPDVQVNVVLPVWQATRERCGARRRGEMRRCPAPSAVDDVVVVAGPEGSGDGLASAAMLYAALANRDYFLVLAGAGQAHTELHESRAEVAEALAVLCAKELHSQGKRVLVNALCAKFTPIDVDGMRARAGRMARPEAALLPEVERAPSPPPATEAERWRLPVRGDRHMSLLTADQRVRIYRLGRAGGVADTSVPPTRVHSGRTTPAQGLARDFLLGGSRIVADRVIEAAIRSEAKRFTAQKVVGDVVHMLWDGSIHWKGFRCVCLAAPPPLPLDNSNSNSNSNSNNNSNGSSTQASTWPSQPALTLAFSRGSESDLSSADEPGPGAAAAQSSELGPEPLLAREWGGSRAGLDGWLARALAPLRIPMLENVLTMVHAFFFLGLYTVVSLERREAVEVEEVLMHVFAVSYVADEVRQCQENGLAVYIKSVWNVLDVAIYSVFGVFFGLRLRSLYTGSAADLDKAYDVLALNSVMLWPRLFSVLDQYEFCGTVIIQVRRIISGTSLFFALLLVMAAGFFQTFYALGVRHNDLGAGSIWGLMTRIFFGSALLGWDQAELFGPYVGVLAMTMYIGVSMLILYNILIGVINQCMMEIEQNAAQEFRFAYTMRVAEYVSARQTYPCVPPLNLLQIAVFWPLRKTALLSPRAFARLRAALLLLAYAPHLLAYAALKRGARWWRARSGMHHRVLRAECHQAEEELVLARTRKDSDSRAALAAEAIAEEDAAPDAAAPAAAAAAAAAGASSPALTLRAGASGRWTALMDAWRGRHATQQAHAADDAPARAAAAHACGNRAAGIDCAERLARIEAQLADIARLVQCQQQQQQESKPA